MYFIRASCVYSYVSVRARLKCDGTHAETRFGVSAKRTSPFKWAVGSVQSTTGSQGVCISGVMLDTPCSEVVWRVLATHSIWQFPLHFPSHASSYAIRFQLSSNKKCTQHKLWLITQKYELEAIFCCQRCTSFIYFTCILQWLSLHSIGKLVNVEITMGWGLGFKSRHGCGCLHHYRPTWDPPSLLSTGYRVSCPG